MIRVLMRDPATGVGVQDDYPDKNKAVDFITAQLLLWKLGKGRLPTEFDMRITEVP